MACKQGKWHEGGRHAIKAGGIGGHAIKACGMRHAIKGMKWHEGGGQAGGMREGGGWGQSR